MTWQLGTVLLLSLAGVANTIYLSYHTYNKKPVKCVFFPETWCLKVQQSKQSKTLKVPNSYLGLLMYLCLTALSVAALINPTQLTFALLILVINIGFIFSMYFTIVQAFVLKAFCTWCVLSAVDFTIMFVVANYFV